MSETKFTPGPWKFHQPWAGFSKITGPCGCLIFGIAAGGVEEKQSDEVCEANARLIAAAPDLYAALADILKCIEIDELIPESVSYMQQARAALVKARGEP